MPDATEADLASPKMMEALERELPNLAGSGPGAMSEREFKDYLIAHSPRNVPADNWRGFIEQRISKDTCLLFTALLRISSNVAYTEHYGCKMVSAEETAAQMVYAAHTLFYMMFTSEKLVDIPVAVRNLRTGKKEASFEKTVYAPEQAALPNFFARLANDYGPLLGFIVTANQAGSSMAYALSGALGNPKDYVTSATRAVAAMAALGMQNVKYTHHKHQGSHIHSRWLKAASDFVDQNAIGPFVRSWNERFPSVTYPFLAAVMLLAPHASFLMSEMHQSHSIPLGPILTIAGYACYLRFMDGEKSLHEQVESFSKELYQSVRDDLFALDDAAHEGKNLGMLRTSIKKNSQLKHRLNVNAPAEEAISSMVADFMRGLEKSGHISAADRIDTAKTVYNFLAGKLNEHRKRCGRENEATLPLAEITILQDGALRYCGAREGYHFTGHHKTMINRIKATGADEAEITTQPDGNGIILLCFRNHQHLDTALLKESYWISQPGASKHPWIAHTQDTQNGVTEYQISLRGFMAMTRNLDAARTSRH